MADRKIKWGVIGCGGIADRRTLPGMLLADNVEIVAVMDTNPKAAEACCEKYGAKYWFTEEAPLLAIEEIECVYIATPVFCHKKQAFAAADAGKQIFIEKPVGMTVKEANEIADYCENKGVKLGVGFVMRFHTFHQQMKEVIASGKLGEIVSARAQLSCWYPEQPGVWRQNPALSGGGALMDMGVHCIDLIRYITGLEVTDVDGMIGNQVFKYGVEDAGAILMRLSNGATAYVDANFNIPDDAAVCKLEIYGTKGSFFAEGTIGQAETGTAILRAADDSAAYDASQQRSGTEAVYLKGLGANIYAKEVEAFGSAVAEGKPAPVSAYDAIRSQMVVEAAYRSSAERRSIKL
ncbi:MAG: Gfo/Idh/MocA family oxidoreductase [Firmicutes bacterium]|nr:Gfo/Idh/MocA family oxidoreductase [Candidatus Colimorpha enterica]